MDDDLRKVSTEKLLIELIVELTHAGPLSKTLPIATEVQRRWRLLQHLEALFRDENKSFWWNKDKGNHVVTVSHHGNTVFMSRRKDFIQILERLREELHVEPKG